MTAQTHQTPVVGFELNGQRVTVEVEAFSSLADVLRTRLGLTGTKKGCNQGACGACTVLVENRRVLSCLTLAVQVEGRSVTTIEGVGTPDTLHDLQREFVTADGFQCGFCTSGQICSALGMLDEIAAGIPSAVSDHVAAEPGPTEPEIRERMSGNLCRCGAYNGIVAAVTAYAGREETG